MIARFLFALLFLGTLNISPDLAAEETQAYSDFFNGDFVELSLRTGFSDVNESTTGQVYELGLRQALPMHLLDTRLAVGLEIFSIEDQADIELYNVNVAGAFHPFYIALVFENWFAWVLASIYLEVGIGAHYATQETESDFGFSYTFGAGLDIPLWNPNHGWSIWINGLYRYRRMDFDLPTQEIDLHNHTGYVGLSVRWNGLLF